jgi:hypothetical protein
MTSCTNSRCRREYVVDRMFTSGSVGNKFTGKQFFCSPLCYIEDRRINPSQVNLNSFKGWYDKHGGQKFDEKRLVLMISNFDHQLEDEED